MEKDPNKSNLFDIIMAIIATIALIGFVLALWRLMT
jgi:F0F1-type ATP synthase membrane subunit c/vacuolar-type H+-ATPase subunit K